MTCLKLPAGGGPCRRDSCVIPLAYLGQGELTPRCMEVSPWPVSSLEVSTSLPPLPRGGEWWGHTAQIQEGVKGAQQVDSYCRGHTPLGHASSRPHCLGHALPGLPLANHCAPSRRSRAQRLQKAAKRKDRAAHLTEPCRELCLLFAAGAGLCLSPGKPSGDSHIHGVSCPLFPPLYSIQAVTQRLSHLSREARP